MQILKSISESLGLQVADVLSSTTTLLLILTFTLIGSYLHEVYQLTRDKNDKIEINKVLLTTLTFTIIIFFASDYIVNFGGFKFLTLVCFVAGGAGYPYVKKVYNGDALRIILSRFGIDLDKKKWEKDSDDSNNNEQGE